jgi:hypothetical protein
MKNISSIAVVEMKRKLRNALFLVNRAIRLNDGSLNGL